MADGYRHPGVESYLLFIDDEEYGAFSPVQRTATIDSPVPNTTYSVRVEATDTLSNQSTWACAGVTTTSRRPAFHWLALPSPQSM